jgi:hypothetical protein
MPWKPASHEARQRAQTRRVYDKAYATQRREAHGPDPRGTQRWRRLRELVLSKHPLCADPYGHHAATGRIEPAVEVDHIQGVWEAPARVFDQTNLRSLCHACHSRASAAARAKQTAEGGD